MPNIAYFISDHGFGQATRAGAVMSAVCRVALAVHFEIFTQTPGWLFQDLPPGAFTLHPLLADIGVAQSGPLHENLPLTLERLNAFLPFDPALVADLAKKINRLRCTLVVCDIAPLGLAVARAAGRPSVLIENFTWDWIYAGYTDREPGLKAHIAYLHFFIPTWSTPATPWSARQVIAPLPRFTTRAFHSAMFRVSAFAR